MIFYFSGTGNSKWVAEKVADAQNDFTISIPAALHERDFIYEPEAEEMIGFVFPVHAWGVPSIVLKFIEQLNIVEYKNNYTFFVATCGDDIGMTSHFLKRALRKTGLQCHSGFSVIMPNTYILLPGFDIDKKSVQSKKISDAAKRLEHINREITERNSGVFECRKGIFPILKSCVIRPLFNKKTSDDKPFHVEGECNVCRKCVHSCPVFNIRIKDGKPIWMGHCLQCLGCIHSCPLHIIQYGKETQNKGRYTMPERDK